MDKTKFTLKDGGQDKHFVIKKMGALQAANWSLGLASLGFNAFGRKDLDWNSDAIMTALSQVDSPKAGELRKQLRESVSVVTGVGEFQLDDLMLEQHIQEFQNVFLIEVEAFKANFGFFIVGGGLKSLVSSLMSAVRPDSTPPSS